MMKEELNVAFLAGLLEANPRIIELDEGALFHNCAKVAIRRQRPFSRERPPHRQMSRGSFFHFLKTFFYNKPISYEVFLLQKILTQHAQGTAKGSLFRITLTTKVANSMVHVPA